MSHSQNASFVGHPTAEIPLSHNGCAASGSFAITPSPAIRDCCDCGTPFFSRSAGNVVCVICLADSTAEFDQGRA